MNPLVVALQVNQHLVLRVLCARFSGFYMQYVDILFLKTAKIVVPLFSTSAEFLLSNVGCTPKVEKQGRVSSCWRGQDFGQRDSICVCYPMDKALQNVRTFLGSGLDPDLGSSSPEHKHVIHLENLECVGQSANLVVDGEHQGGLPVGQVPSVAVNGIPSLLEKK